MCFGHKSGPDQDKVKKRDESPAPLNVSPSPSATAVVQRESPSPAPSTPQNVIPPPPPQIPVEGYDLAAAIASAAPDATVKIPAGFYQAGLVVKKPIHIVGDPKTGG
jgi:hypothetical protein